MARWLAIGLLALLAAALPAAQPPTQPLTITFAGDVMPAGKVGVEAKRVGMGVLLSAVSPLLMADDLTIANLECPVARRGAKQEKRYTFRADPAVLPGLRAAGVDAVTLANNHSLDYGPAALLDTFRHLQEAQIPFAGAGPDADRATTPLLLEMAGRRIALVAASRVIPSTTWRAGDKRPGLATAYDGTALVQRVRQAGRQADLVIVYLHWGVERAVSPQQWQRTLARQLVEAGADLVVGSHPHVLQGFEYHQGKLIAYSLGNFLFRYHDTTALLQVTWAGDRVIAAVTPCVVARWRPSPTTGRARAAALRALEARSFGVRIGKDGEITPR